MADYIVELNSNTNTYQVIVSNDGSATNFSESFMLGGNQTVFTLSHTPVSNSLHMYVNGLLQLSSNYSISGATITVTGFTPTTNDEIAFSYRY